MSSALDAETLASLNAELRPQDPKLAVPTAFALSYDTHGPSEVAMVAAALLPAHSREADSGPGRA